MAANIDRPDVKNKPVQSIVERYVQLSAVKFVDEIIVYDTEKDLEDMLMFLPITVRIIGEEYKDKDFTGKELSHIEMYYNFRKHSFSTTELRMRVIEKYKLEKLPVFKRNNPEIVKNIKKEISNNILFNICCIYFRYC